MHRGRFVLACIVAAAVILWAPFVSDIRRWIRTEFPGHFALIVGATIGILIGGALAVTLLRIRERRPLRYGALAAAVLLGTGYSLWNAEGVPEVDVVERFHFVEFGLVTLLFYRAWRPLNDLSTFVLPVLAGLLVGTLEEWFQWFIPIRVGEMRDIFLNMAAIGSGLLFSVAVDPPPTFSGRLRPGSMRQVAMFTSVVFLAFAAFVHAVHLGYEIRDERAGTFRSRYTAPQLAELSVMRSNEWIAQPPPLTAPRLSREDQYLTEGVEHVRERNKLWGTGDVEGAWFENLILETYYAPVVVTPSYHAKTGSKWPDEQRANAELASSLTADKSLQRRNYISRSNPAPILTWPKSRYWLAVGATVIAILGAAAFVARQPSEPRR